MDLRQMFFQAKQIITYTTKMWLINMELKKVMLRENL